MPICSSRGAVSLLRASEYLPLCPCPRKPRVDSLPDHRALKLCEYPEHLEHRLTYWRGGIEALLMKVEANTLRVNLTKDADQVLKGAAYGRKSVTQLALPHSRRKPADLVIIVGGYRSFDLLEIPKA